jgi:hypothetical protein
VSKDCRPGKSSSVNSFTASFFGSVSPILHYPDQLFVHTSFVRSFFVVMQCAGSVDVCMRTNMAETGGLSFCLVNESCRRNVGELFNFLLIYFRNCDLDLNESVSTAQMNMV